MSDAIWPMVRARIRLAGGKAATPTPAVAVAPAAASVTEGVDLEALSDQDIDRLLGPDTTADEVPDPK